MNPEKPTDLPQVTDKHILLHRMNLDSTRVGFELTTLVVIGTDFIGSWKSNYQTITATTTLLINFENMFVPKYQYHEYCYSDSNISLQHLHKFYDFKHKYF